MADITLREAIHEGFLKAGWQQPTEDVIRQIEFCVNSMEARSANEALKRERVDEGVNSILEWFNTTRVFDAELVKAIITKVAG